MLRQHCLQWDGELLTSMGDIIEWWKDYNEDLLNSAGCCGTTVADTPLQCCVVVRDSASGLADRGGGSPSQEGRPEDTTSHLAFSLAVISSWREASAGLLLPTTHC
ncbi:hypothetical protein AMECASPLE_032310 [Ameca splendens]|uniref:Uncharacterized protein n=1 Tax=Ameca splendens TaxID=208324 RepID=A0ABV1AEN1_9TELE